MIIMSILLIVSSLFTTEASPGLTIPKDIQTRDTRNITSDELVQEFNRDGNVFPDAIIRKYAVMDVADWERLEKKRDAETGYEYIFEKLSADGHGDIYALAMRIHAPVEAGLKSAVEYNKRNSGNPIREIKVETKLQGETRKLRLRTGTIIDGSRFRSVDENGNEVYGYRIAMQTDLPKPVSDKSFVLRVLIHYKQIDGKWVLVSESYQAEGEGEFKRLISCQTFSDLGDGTHLFTIKSESDPGGILGGINRFVNPTSLAEKQLKSVAFSIANLATSSRGANRRSK